MSKLKYKRLRQSLGTQEDVAKMLGVSRETLSNRERGESSIRNEHILALKNLIKGEKDAQDSER